MPVPAQSWPSSACRPTSAPRAEWRACPIPQDPRDPGGRHYPVMAKARIGHFVEAQLLEALEVDYIDESEVLTPLMSPPHQQVEVHRALRLRAINLGEALRRISEGAAMIRTKARPAPATWSRPCATCAPSTARSTGSRAWTPMSFTGGQGPLLALRPGRLGRRASQAAGGQLLGRGIATPADAALMMQLGAEASSSAPASSRARTPPGVPRRSCGRPPTSWTPRSSPRSLRPREAMPGKDIRELGEENLIQFRGW